MTKQVNKAVTDEAETSLPNYVTDTCMYRLLGKEGRVMYIN